MECGDGPCPSYPDGGSLSLRTSMTSDSLLCLEYEFCPAKGSRGQWTGSSDSIEELVRGLNLKLLNHSEYPSTCLRLWPHHQVPHTLESEHPSLLYSLYICLLSGLPKPPPSQIHQHPSGIVICPIYSLEMLYAQASTSSTSRTQPLNGVPEQLTFSSTMSLSRGLPRDSCLHPSVHSPMRKIFYSLL